MHACASPPSAQAVSRAKLNSSLFKLETDKKRKGREAIKNMRAGKEREENMTK